MSPRQRRPRGDGSVYKEHRAGCAKGRCSCPWRGRMEYTDESGKQHRKKLPLKPTKAEASAQLADAVTKLNEGQLPDDDSTTVAQWAEYFLTVIAPRGKSHSNRHMTVRTYRQKLRDHALPVIGRKRLSKIRPEDLEAVYTAMRSKGLSEATVASVHRVLRRMFGLAERRRRIPRNPAVLLDAPTPKRKLTTTLTKEETTQALYAAVSLRNGVRWGLGLGVGMRQSECLALSRDMLDLDTGVVEVRYGLHRARPEHGCGPGREQLVRQVSNGVEKMKMVFPCGQAQPGRCPKRKGPPSGLFLEPVKSEKSNRFLGLPPQMVTWFRRHLEEQGAERTRDGGWEPCRLLVSPDPITGEGEYTDVDLLFRQPGGAAIDPRRDETAWKELLVAAGVPTIKLHGARHTTATLLLEEGEPVKVVSELLGHSSHHFTADTYQHVTARRSAKALASISSILPSVPASDAGTLSGTVRTRRKAKRTGA